MNIFVTSPWPAESATCLPDKHIVKMPLECCQMLSIVASEKWGNNYGTLPKSDGTAYRTEKGAFRNHPCTKWAMENINNAYWLIKHGLNLCDEYALRYNKTHSCYGTLVHAYYIFPKGKVADVTPFVRAMPDEYKLDTSIDTFTAYKMYIASKPWAASNYLRMPERKPEWI
jgi:Pyrimidine dimer DNA glycosylase